MSLLEKIRALVSGSKDRDGDGIPDELEEEEAIAALRRDQERSGLDAVDRLNTPGSSDRGTWG
jgi:hypothetical protein